MIVNELDLGGRPAYVRPQGGQAVTSAQVYGGRPVTVTMGASLDKMDVDFWVEAWQALGGSPAGSLAALRLLIAQLEELAQNPDLQPVYVQPFLSSQTGAMYPSRSDSRDGWHWIDALAIDRESYNGRGAVQATATFTRVAQALPSGLGLSWAGGAYSSTYTAVPVPLLAYPVGSTQQVATALSRTGGEGAIPLSVLASGSTVQPSWFARPATIAGLFTGGVKVFDTVSVGGNAVPAAGAGFANANWVQVYGTQHDLTGDLIVTNGLFLLRMSPGGSGVPDVYLWNTQGTAGWNQLASDQYKDSPSFNVGTIRGIDLVAVGYQSAIVRVTLGTSAGNYARFLIQLDAGQYGVAVIPDFRTQANSVAYGMDLVSISPAIKIVANESAAVDVGLNPSTNLAPSAGAGWAVGIGTTANQPLVGLGWQNPPNAGQPAAGSTTDLGFGETTGPAAGSLRRYFIWAAPFATSPNLLAEAESGTAGTNWTTVADGAAPGGNVERCANANPSGNANTWGTAWQPPPGKYRMRVRLKLGSLASSTSQMKIGLWNSTDSVYVGSTTYAPNAAALAGGTSFIWIDVTGLVTPTAGKNMRFRAETTATTTTNWDFDQAVLVPEQSATLGQGDFPADIWAQLMYGKTTRLVRG